MNDQVDNCDDIINNRIINRQQYDKLTELSLLMKNYIKQVSYLPNSIIFGLPINFAIF